MKNNIILYISATSVFKILTSKSRLHILKENNKINGDRKKMNNLVSDKIIFKVNCDFVCTVFEILIYCSFFLVIFLEMFV